MGVAISEEGSGVHVNAITEAPSGFDNLTNGFSTQAAMDAARDSFETTESFADGIGPVFNNTSCVSCHQNPFFQTGTGSQISELRAGHPGAHPVRQRGADVQDHPQPRG
ncbi:MAG: hypothetical protein E6J90_34690 [Deltaproteobacteria bacterium]|nr:MAG: hypothetical protein E6J90_34690 [Deltaproteobacteria bacterium]